MGVRMRLGALAISVVFGGILSLLAVGAEAQTVQQGTRSAPSSQPFADEPFAQAPVLQPPRRLRIYPRYQAEPDGVYPRYFPGSNAVRVCSATYVQEYRPSGTVIVPHTSCSWRRG